MEERAKETGDPLSDENVRAAIDALSVEERNKLMRLIDQGNWPGSARPYNEEIFLPHLAGVESGAEAGAA